MSKYGPLKQGEKRDNKVFWRYRRDGSEYWLTEAKFRKYKKTAKKHLEATSASCRHKIKPAMYSQHPVTLLYYVGTYCGKEKWIEFSALEKYKMGSSESRKRYVNKQKHQPPTTLKIGDRHPENPNLWVVCRQYNHIFFGTHDEYLRRLNITRECSRRKAMRYKIQRDKVLLNRDHVYKRGDKRDGLIFWKYGSTCIEYWLTKDQFEAKLQHERDAAMKAKGRRKANKRNNT
jgi:hypothetical protein